MPKPLPTLDPLAFAERLKQALDGFPEIPAGRGRNEALAKRYFAKPPTVNAWLQGKHLPTPDRVLAMAQDTNQSFMWLYFGIGSKSDPETRATPASQPAGLRPDKLVNATRALLVFLRRRDPKATIDLEDLGDAQLLAAVYGAAVAMPDQPSDEAQQLFGAHVASLVEAREARESERRSSSQPSGSTAGKKARK